MREGSLTTVLFELEPGESYAKAFRHDPATEYDPSAASARLEQLRVDVQAPVKRATRHGRKYMVETGSFLTRAGHPTFVVVVTRTDEGDATKGL